MSWTTNCWCCTEPKHWIKFTGGRSKKKSVHLPSLKWFRMDPPIYLFRSKMFICKIFFQSNLILKFHIIARTCRILHINILWMYYKSLGNLLNIFHNVEKLKIHHGKLPQYILPDAEDKYVKAIKPAMNPQSNSNNVVSTSMFCFSSQVLLKKKKYK